MRLLIVLLCCSSYLTMSAQDHWQQAMHDHSNNFYDIQRSFEQEQAAKTGEEATRGTKPYYRWEAYWEDRVDEAGNFPEPGQDVRAMEAYYQHRAGQKSYVANNGDWELLGPSSTYGSYHGGGRLSAIAFHPTDPDVLFVGAPSGGFWKSTDRGQTWTQYVTGMTRLGVSSIVVHPTTPNIIYIATGDRDGGDAKGYGVWRSTDGGLTWSPHNNGMGNRTINKLIMDPNNSNVMIAVGQDRKIYRTTNGGGQWTTAALLNDRNKDLVMHPTNSNIVYAAGTEFIRSDDGGQTWTTVTNGLPTGVQRMAIAVSPDRPDWVYVLSAVRSGLDGIYLSTDGGLSFTQQRNSPNLLGWSTTGRGGQSWYNLVIAARPDDAEQIIIGAVRLSLLDQRGTNLVQYNPTSTAGGRTLHPDHHVLEFSPHDGALFCGNDGGIHRSTDGGATWEDLSSGLAIAQVYKIGVSYFREEEVLSGYQDNGTSLYQNKAFYASTPGDGMECEFDRFTNDRYTSMQRGSILRNGSWLPRVNENGSWVTPFKLDPHTPGRLLAGYQNVWVFNTNGYTWTKISDFSNSKQCADLAIAPSVNGVVYVSRKDKSFHVCRNSTAAQPTWTDLTPYLPVSDYPRDIEIDPTNSYHLFILMRKGVYESTDGGYTWTNINGSLPRIHFNTLVIDPASTVKGMYLGMDVGVYYRDTTLNDWEPFFTGLPNVEVTELNIRHQSKSCEHYLYAGTYGQGLWRSTLKAVGRSPQIACFRPAHSSLCQNNVLQLRNESQYPSTHQIWSFSPSVQLLNGSSAQDAEPTVMFPDSGWYSIYLIAYNALGVDTTQRRVYIDAASSPPDFSEDFEQQALTPLRYSAQWNNPLWTMDNHRYWAINNGQPHYTSSVDSSGDTSTYIIPWTSTLPGWDVTTGVDTGHYLSYGYHSYDYGNRAPAALTSSCMSLSSNMFLTFHYHASCPGCTQATSYPAIHVDVLVDGQWHNDVHTLSSGSTSGWQFHAVPLSAYANKTVQMRLRPTQGARLTSSSQSGISIDDLQILAGITTAQTFSMNVANDHGANAVRWSFDHPKFDGAYDVQRLVGSSWVTLATTDATVGKLHYEWSDSTLTTGTATYRIVARPNDPTQQEQLSPEGSIYRTAAVHHLVVYPNPTSGTMYLELESEVAGALPYRLSNALGQTLRQSTFPTQPGLNSFALPLEAYPPGIYLLHVQGNTIKLVKN